MTKAVLLPRHDDLFKPILEVLAKLGGSGSIEELDETLVAAINASQEQLDVTYPKSGAAVLADRMSWARSFLKFPGFVANPKRGVWVLTEKGRAAAGKSNGELKQIVNAAYKASVAARKAAQASVEGENDQEVKEGAFSWPDQLLQRLQIIDLRVNLISFQVLFQCKRWKGSVGSEVVRNFRGAMQGRADKGLVITTGTFTADARKEATRDGAPAIDLIDGEALCMLMKDLSLGVHVREVRLEEVDLDADFFTKI